MGVEANGDIPLTSSAPSRDSDKRPQTIAVKQRDKLSGISFPTIEFASV